MNTEKFGSDWEGRKEGRKEGGSSLGQLPVILNFTNLGGFQGFGG
jgi:hypothetical protein